MIKIQSSQRNRAKRKICISLILCIVLEILKTLTMNTVGGRKGLERPYPPLIKLLDQKLIFNYKHQDGHNDRNCMMDAHCKSHSLPQGTFCISYHTTYIFHTRNSECRTKLRKESLSA